MPDPAPLAVDAREWLDLRGFGAVIIAGGFRPDYRSWVNIPGAFDELGFPIHDEGASTVAPGLCFVGVHLLRNRKSSLFLGVGDAAAIVAEEIAAASAARPAGPSGQARERMRQRGVEPPGLIRPTRP